MAMSLFIAILRVRSAKCFLLGRPWRPFAKTVFMFCNLDNQVAPEGWSNWGKVENEKTTYYAEYKNTGAGAATNARVAWAHQLTDSEASRYTLQYIFGDWMHGHSNIIIYAYLILLPKNTCLYLLGVIFLILKNCLLKLATVLKPLS